MVNMKKQIEFKTIKRFHGHDGKKININQKG
jgi:hypothetical protein